MSVSPMQLFEEQVSSEDSALRLDAMCKLGVVGKAMGPDDTLGSLLPFLAAHTDDDDEMLLKMAQQLGTMVPSLVPGPSAFPIVSILETLCGVEETVVRSAAVASLTAVVPHLPSSDSGKLLDAVKRLASSDWFTGRVSSCGLAGACYSHLLKAGAGVGADDLRKVYAALATDETPMVRRGAASAFGSFAAVVEKEHQAQDMVNIYSGLAQDEQDSVRQLIVTGASSIGIALADASQSSLYVFPVVKNACNDRSWRVRHAVAKDYPEIVTSLGASGDFLEQMIGCFLGLLQDTEAEVRGAAAGNIAAVVEIAGCDVFTNDIAPLLDGLSKDPVMEVRSKLSSALMSCCKPSECSKVTDDAIVSHIQPVIQAMLANEEEADEVKINILRELPSLTRFLAQMKEITSMVAELSKYDLNWRVRECVALIAPSIAESVGIDAFASSFLQIYLSLLADQVADVRAACVSGIYKIYTVASEGKDGAAWIQKNVLAPLKPTYDSSTFYLTRITHLRLHAALCPTDGAPRALLETVVTALSLALQDAVPNVRTVATTCLIPIVSFCDDSLINATIRPAFERAADSADLSVADEMSVDNDFRIQLRELSAVLEA